MIRTLTRIVCCEPVNPLLLISPLDPLQSHRTEPPMNKSSVSVGRGALNVHDRLRKYRLRRDRTMETPRGREIRRCVLRRMAAK